MSPKALAVLTRLSEVADAYDNQCLASPRKPDNPPFPKPANLVIVYAKGGLPLLTIQDCYEARDLVLHTRKEEEDV